MSVQKLLLWEKWRPKKLEDIILLPRIREKVEGGGNFIFYGNYGTGKTSLARILIGLYTKDKPFLEINSSISTSINTLRGEIEDFCKFTPMMDTDSDIKWVFLDEFERTSAEFQDAFKAFVEKYSKRGVRFIITTNHINKIDGGIKSRIPQINFDCQNIEEEKYLKTEMFKRITGTILPTEGKEIPKEDLVKIITKKFPDFRATLVDIGEYLKTGSLENSGNVSNKIKEELYNVVTGKSKDYEKIYSFLQNSFGQERIDVMIKLLGRPFIDWALNKNINVDKLFDCNYIISDYGSKLENNTDPIILGMTIIGKFIDILN